jgi:tetratricopeptide (TPR) repeat protein
MLTIKKQERGITFAIASVLCLLLTSCGPPGSRPLHHGNELLKNGQVDEAIEAFREAILKMEHSPAQTQAQAWNFLGLAYHRKGDATDARKCYEQALKLDRNLAAADYNEGCLELDQTNYARAASLFTTYTNLRSRDVVGYARLGTARLRLASQNLPLQERRKLLDEARRDYELAQSIAPTAEAWNGLGVIELERHGAAGAQAAKKDFESAFQQNPKFTPALLNEGIVLDQYLGDRKTALEKYKLYQSVETNSPNAAKLSRLIKQVHDEVGTTLGAAKPPPDVAPPATVPTRTREATSPAQPRTFQTTSPTSPSLETRNPRVETNEPAAPVASSTVTPSRSSPPTQTLSSVPDSQTLASPPDPSNPVTPAPAPAPPPKQEPMNLVLSGHKSSTTDKPSSSGGSTGDIRSPKPDSPPPGGVKLFFRHLNPATWFGGGKSASDAPANSSSPQTQSPPSQTASGNTTAPSQPGEDVSARYSPSEPVLTKGDRGDAMRFVNVAKAAQRDGRAADALQAFRDGVKADPTCYEASFGFGMAALEAKDYNTALDALHQAILIREDSADARYAYAWALERRHYYLDAADQLEKMLAEHPDEVRGHLLLGNIYSQHLGKADQARDHYGTVLRLDAHNAQAPAIRAWLHDNPPQ